jgi:ubiquitin-like protein ATG12
MSDSDLPLRSSPQQATPIPDDDHEADLPLTMTASVVLTSLPRDAAAALKGAGAFEKPKGIPSSSTTALCSAFSQWLQ